MANRSHADRMSDSMSPPVLDAGPDYFETYFPKDAFPNYGWSNLPPGLPAQAWTTETTHRDGQQGGLPFTAKQRVAVYQILCDFTGQSGASGKQNSLSTAFIPRRRGRA